MWTAFAVALTTVGVAAFLGYLVAVESAEPPRDVEWLGAPVLLSGLCIVVGLGMMGAILRSLHGERRIRTRINNLLTEGIRLLRDVRSEQDQTKIPTFEHRADEWGDRVYKTLQQDVPQYSALFLVEAYSGTQFSVSGRKQQSLIGNWLERRTARLAEILLKV